MDIRVDAESPGPAILQLLGVFGYSHQMPLVRTEYEKRVITGEIVIIRAY